jgi:protein SCO1/2
MFTLLPPFGRQIAALALAIVVAAPAMAQIAEGLPADMVGVGIDQKVGDQIPLDVEFVNEQGEKVQLKDIFSGERPVLLSLNYASCPMLCRLQLNSLVQTLQELEFTTGQEFDVLSVSIDPKETPRQAQITKENYVQQYGREGAADGWKFLVGKEENIRKLADAVGFRYNFVPDTGEYAHSAALMVVTPDGVLARYINGLAYDAKTLRLSLVEAGEGKIGSVFDQFFLSCYAYDHTKGRYAPMANRIMQVGASTTVLLLGLGLIPYWFRRQRHPAPTGSSAEAAAPSPTATEPGQEPAAR